MSIYHILNLIFYAEILLLLLIFILIVIIHVVSPVLEKKNTKIKQRFSEIIIDYITTKKPFSKEKKFASHPEFLLQIMEDFNHRLNGENWEPLKLAIATHYLLPRARKFAKSIFWPKRNIAARCFSLAPLLEDEKQILLLVDDSKFLVRSRASVAAVQLESENGIFKSVEHMSLEYDYAYYYYSDILSQGSTKVLIFISQIPTTNENPKIHLACLSILGSKTMPFPLPFLQKDLQAKNLQIRLSALKVLLKNPQKNTSEIFLHCMNDPNEDIRSIGAMGLAQNESKDCIETLTNALKDPSWKVRLAAARSLKQMGQMDVLMQQKKENHKDAYEAAQYGMQFE